RADRAVPRTTAARTACRQAGDERFSDLFMSAASPERDHGNLLYYTDETVGPYRRLAANVSSRPFAGPLILDPTTTSAEPRNGALRRAPAGCPGILEAGPRTQSRRALGYRSVLRM